ncbi:MAG TPA: DUF2249 domain-containing protein [Burkholderiales bacterium]|nr:DUF2249 domain-containing protein [Burkholderiales bacterium]
MGVTGTEAHYVSLKDLLAQALDAARTADWPSYRSHFAALRAALGERIAEEEEAHEDNARLRRHLETLGAAAPEHDPQGYLAELEALGALLRAHHAGKLQARVPGAAPALDLRGLQPPEPIVRIFQALERAPGEPLRAILPHEPVPLYALLHERGFAWRGAPRTDGGYELVIERS